MTKAQNLTSRLGTGAFLVNVRSMRDQAYGHAEPDDEDGQE